MYIYICVCVLVYWRLAKTRGGKLLLIMASIQTWKFRGSDRTIVLQQEHMMLRWKAWNHPRCSSLLIVVF